MGHGRVFALYVALYTLGRSWIEYLRVDPAREVLGLRLNVWTSVLVLVGAVVYIVVSARRRPGRETPAELRGAAAAAHPAIEDPPVPGDDAATGADLTVPAAGLESGDPAAPSSDEPVLGSQDRGAD
jgi:Prolipoprotein diacylglyceryl transferase